MSDSCKRYIQINDWCFEVKMVRALRVNEYGEPYSAIANCNLNGDAMYIDGLMTKEGQEFTKDDFKAFYQFAEQMKLDSVSYHRYQNGRSITREVKIAPTPPEQAQINSMRLVK